MPTSQEKIHNLMQQADENKTLERSTELYIQAIGIDMTLERRIVPAEFDNEIIRSFRENAMDINIIKPLILNHNKFALKILLQLFAEAHDGAFELSMDLFRANSTPPNIKQAITKVAQAVKEVQSHSEEVNVKLSISTTPVKKKVSSADDITDNETNSGGSSANSYPTGSPTKDPANNKPADDHVVPADGGCVCIISYCTDIIYDNPVLNQINKNGLFSLLNWNPNFDSYNFDPKAFIRAESLLQVNDVVEINFDSIFPNVASANADALPDQAYSILESFGLSPLGAISLVAAALVAFQS